MESIQYGFLLHPDQMRIYSRKTEIYLGNTCIRIILNREITKLEKLYCACCSVI